MANSGNFIQHVCELFAPLGRATARRMFGGSGIYLDGLFIALIANDELYLKTDDMTRATFERQGCAPFVFQKDGKVMVTSYRHAPEVAMDAPHLMQPWARLAQEAGLRARAAKAVPKKKTAAEKKSSRPPTKKRTK